MRRPRHPCSAGPWLAVVLAALPLSAQEPTGPPAERYFGNVELINQDGEPLRLYRDLLHGKVVVIDTIFTACTGVCPVLSKTMERIQEHVGDRLGRDVLLLSITVDPENDTPQKLKQFAARWNARPGWHFLTGKPENVETALRKLGGWVEDREAHNAILIIGNEPTGLWKKALGMVPVTQILPIVDSVLHDPGAGTPPAGGPG